MGEKFKEVFGNRIRGAKNREERINAQKILKEDFEKGEKEFTSYEISKTERDKENINQAINSVYEMIKDVGVDPGEPFDEKRIHLLARGGLWALTKGKFSGAFCNNDSHFMAIDKSSSEIKNRLDIGHELGHLKGKKRAEIKGPERKVAFQGSCIAIYRKGEQGKRVGLLGKLEEGIVGLLNRIIFEHDIKNNPFYADELKMVEKIKPWLDKAWGKKRRLQ